MGDFNFSHERYEEMISGKEEICIHKERYKPVFHVERIVM